MPKTEKEISLKELNEGAVGKIEREKRQYRNKADNKATKKGETRASDAAFNKHAQSVGKHNRRVKEGKLNEHRRNAKR